jgi:hypothetical protein
MIVGTLATFPARRAHLAVAVAALAPQLDRLFVVLNEYTDSLPELNEFGNVEQIIPPHDLKDTGKFYPDMTDAEWVFTLDDDILYPPDYVTATLAKMAALGKRRVMGGYHGSVYIRQPLRGWRPRQLRYWLHTYRGAASSRNVIDYRDALQEAFIVDQLGTGVSVMRAEDWPGFEAMESSQRFVDVRLARLCHERQIAQVCLPRSKGWIEDGAAETSIFQDFTKRDPRHVTREIRQFAFRVSGRDMPFKN